MGLRVQMGHLPGQPYARPDGPMDFVLLDTNGIHTISVDWCACKTLPRYVQVLRARWWPATPLHPQSGATIRCLNLFHLLNTQAKTTAHDYWRVQEQLTDATGVSDIPVSLLYFLCRCHAKVRQDRINALRVMSREFDFIRLAKRAGLGHACGGLEDISAGCLALTCSTCPREGINVPETKTSRKEER